jgi:DHA1 family bicyclomycin/chloramphenicol resistance-like MFS transporter
MSRPAGDPVTAAGSAARRVPALWLLALITLSGTLAMHIFVPALPLVAADLGVSNAGVQLTVSAYIIGLSVAQLVYGPMSDHFGRRPVLFFGMGLFSVASVIALLAPNLPLLIATRFLQALGGGAGLVLGRAIVRDMTSGNDAARKQSLMNLMVMVGPGLSPLVGSLLAEVTGWRSIFAALSLLGLGNLFLIWRRLPETAGVEGRVRGGMLRSYGQLLRMPAFVGYAIGGGFATTALYAFIGAAPFIFVDQLHRPAAEVGAYLMFNIVGVWFGSFTASRLIGRFAAGRLMVVGNLISCVSAVTFLGLVLGGWLSVPTVIVPVLALSFGAGLASPMALSEALSVNPSIAGSASGLYGFTQMVIGAICAALSSIGANPALAVALVLTMAGAIAQLSFWLAGRARTAAIPPV